MPWFVEHELAPGYWIRDCEKDTWIEAVARVEELINGGSGRVRLQAFALGRDFIFTSVADLKQQTKGMIV